ncbi:MAG: ABC transporter ATP-binding protein, partial [Pseudomonadota bacterium]
IAWEGDPARGGRPGLWREYEGGYEEWLRQRPRAGASAAPAAATPPPAAPAGPDAVRSPPARAKLGYIDQRELEALPARIDALEAEQRAIGERLADPAFFVADPVQAAAQAARHAQIEDELMACLERWEQLAARG